MGWISSQQLMQEQQALVDNLKNSKLSVGHSESTASIDSDVGTLDRTPFSYQTSGGESDLTTGVQKFLKLVGCDVVNNQKCYDPHLTNASNWKVYIDSLARINSISGGVAEVEILSLEGVTSYNYYSLMFQEKDVYKTPTAVGHIHLFWADVYSPKSGDMSVYNQDGDPQGQSVKSVSANTWTRIYGISTATRTIRYMSAYPYFMPEVGDVFKYRNFGDIDLTQYFGNNNVVNAIMGNGTKDEQVANLISFLGGQLPSDYDTGILVPSKSAKLFNTGFNQFDYPTFISQFQNPSAVPSQELQGKRLWINNCGYTGRVQVYKNGFTHTSGGVVYIRFVFTDGTQSGYPEAYLLENTTTITSEAGKVVSRVDLLYSADGVYNCSNGKLCVSLYWDGSRNGQYEDYDPHTYELPNRTIHGILQVDGNGKVYADGDELLPDGTGSENYEEYTILGTETVTQYQFDGVLDYVFLNVPIIKGGQALYLPSNIANTVQVTTTSNADNHWLAITFVPGVYNNLSSAITAITGKKVIIPLDTPVAITGEQTFTATPHVDDFGTMMFQDENGVQIAGFQGNEILYKANVAGFAESLYVNADGDPDAIALKTDIDDTALNTRGYYKTQDLSASLAILSGRNITSTTKKVYKQGNLVFVTAIFKNETGATLTTGTDLFNFASGLRPDVNLSFQLVGSKSFTIATTGNAWLSQDWENNTSIMITITYAIA